MMNAKRALRLSWLAFGSVSVLLASCDRMTETPTGVAILQSSVQPEPLLATPIPTWDSPRPPEVPSAYLSQRLPGFGGLYLEGGKLVAVLTPGTNRTDADSVLRAFMHEVGDLLPDAIRLSSDLTVRDGDYSFRELQIWRDAINVWAFSLEGVSFTSLNQVRNRVVIGLGDRSTRAEVEALLTESRVPMEAVEIVERSVHTNAGPQPQGGNGPTLRDYRRPVEGGLLLARPWDNPGVGCTVGFNAIQLGWRRLVTASHCSSQFTHTDYTYFYQEQAIDDSVHYVGLEYKDPTRFWCKWVRTCRYSDATLIAVGPYVETNQGHIARTTAIGSRTVDPVNPSFAITGYLLTFFPGQELQMMGQASGWRAGTVTGNICVDAGHPSGGIMLCQTEANYFSQNGDSGAPIFYLTIGGVLLAGTHWGNDDAPWPYTLSVFSPVSGIMQDLGSFDALAPQGPPPPPPPPVDVTIMGPTEIQPEAVCSWQAQVDPAGGDYTYVWYNDGLLDGSGPYYMGGKDPGNLTDHFTLRVDVSGGGIGSGTITVYESPSARVCMM